MKVVVVLPQRDLRLAEVVALVLAPSVAHRAGPESRNHSICTVRREEYRRRYRDMYRGTTWSLSQATDLTLLFSSWFSCFRAHARQDKAGDSALPGRSRIVVESIEGDGLFASDY